MALARLNLSHFLRGTNEERDAFAAQLASSFAAIGFIKLDDHGFSAADVAEMFEWNHRFFAMPIEDRASCAHVPGPSPQRGYGGVGNENLAKFHSMWTGEREAQERKDLKAWRLHDVSSRMQGLTFGSQEIFDMGPEHDEAYPNRWPPETSLPGFRAYMDAAYRRFEGIAHTVLAALEIGLRVPPGSFTGRCEGHVSEFRFVHYPAVTADELRGGSISRAWPHYDVGVLSFLFQDHVGGLEMSAGREGDNFVSVVSNKSTDLIVNVAETLQRWSNGILKAGLHRVTVPPSVKPGEEGRIEERYSIVYFSKPGRQASAGPLRDLVNTDQPARFEDLTFIDYHKCRIATAY